MYEWMGSHSCPRPSIEQVQREVNKVINPALFQPLEVDGIAGARTVEAWSFYSVGWEAENERRMSNGH
jgi:hypothetical protein